MIPPNNPITDVRARRCRRRTTQSRHHDRLGADLPRPPDDRLGMRGERSVGGLRATSAASNPDTVHSSRSSCASTVASCASWSSGDIAIRSASSASSATRSTSPSTTGVGSVAVDAGSLALDVASEEGVARGRRRGACLTLSPPPHELSSIGCDRDNDHPRQVRRLFTGSSTRHAAHRETTRCLVSRSLGLRSATPRCTRQLKDVHRSSEPNRIGGVCQPTWSRHSEDQRSWRRRRRAVWSPVDGSRASTPPDRRGRQQRRVVAAGRRTEGAADDVHGQRVAADVGEVFAQDAGRAPDVALGLGDDLAMVTFPRRRRSCRLDSGRLGGGDGEQVRGGDGERGVGLQRPAQRRVRPGVVDQAALGDAVPGRGRRVGGQGSAVVVAHLRRKLVAGRPACGGDRSVGSRRGSSAGVLL